MKTILITGVLGGMGSATAELLIKNGYNVIGLDVKDGGDLPFVYFKTDLTKESEIQRTYDEIQKTHSEIRKKLLITHNTFFWTEINKNR